jgi:hypothetical protein
MKKCTKCRKEKNCGSFSKNKNNKDGLSYRCKVCDKQYRKDNKDRISKYNRLYREKNKEKASEYNSQYQKINKEKLSEQKRVYREKNKEEVLEYSKIYRKNNKENLAEYIKQYQKDREKELSKYIKQYYLNNKEDLDKKSKLYREKHKNSITINRRQYKAANAKYEAFKDKLTVDEAPKLASDGISLEVKCRYCGKYFIPNNVEIIRRVSALNGDTGRENSLYCSDNCKSACPVFKQINWPKGFKPSSSREVNPLVRQLCFERDEWACQICGATQEDDQLHCHHLEGVAKNPRLGNDVTNTITLCKTCHKQVHKLPGCGYTELRCNKNYEY